MQHKTEVLGTFSSSIAAASILPLDFFPGYAFIEFEHERDLKNAYKQGDGKKIDGILVLLRGVLSLGAIRQNLVLG